MARSVGEIIAAGAVGINLEDGTGRVDAPILGIDEAASRIRAARNAAREAAVPIVINARIDIYLKQIGEPASRFAETVRRAEAYLAAGADCIFPFAVTDADTIGRLTRAIQAPVNIVGRAEVGEYGYATAYASVLIVLMIVVVVLIRALIGRRRVSARQARADAGA